MFPVYILQKVVPLDLLQDYGTIRFDSKILLRLASINFLQHGFVYFSTPGFWEFVCDKDSLGPFV